MRHLIDSLRPCSRPLIVGLALAAVAVGGLVPGASPTLDATQRLCGDQPCDGREYDSGARLPLREQTDQSRFRIETEYGRLDLPVTVKRWAEWRLTQTVAGADEAYTGYCYGMALPDVTQAVSLAARIEGSQVARIRFGSGIRDNLGAMVEATREHAEAGGWSAGWDVELPAGQSAQCWVLEGWVEITPQWSEVSNEEIMSAFGLGSEQGHPFRTAGEGEDVESSETANQLRQQLIDGSSAERHQLVIERTLATTFESS